MTSIHGRPNLQNLTHTTARIDVVAPTTPVRSLCDSDEYFIVTVHSSDGKTTGKIRRCEGEVELSGRLGIVAEATAIGRHVNAASGSRALFGCRPSGDSGPQAHQARFLEAYPLRPPLTGRSTSFGS